MTDEPPKRKAGRPKLPSGKKGNYNVSSIERKKREVRKRVKGAKQLERNAKKKLAQLKLTS